MFAYKCKTPSLQWCQEQFSNVSSSINHFWKYCSKLYTDVFMTCFQMVHGAHILFAIATLTSLTSYFSSPSSSKRWMDASTSDCFHEGLWNVTKYFNIKFSVSAAELFKLQKKSFTFTKFTIFMVNKRFYMFHWWKIYTLRLPIWQISLLIFFILIHKLQILLLTPHILERIGNCGVKVNL